MQTILMPFFHLFAKIRRRPVLWFWGVFFAACLNSGAAENRTSLANLLTGATSRTEFKNTLGMTFTALPESPVLLSIWETRVADWAAFTKATQLQWVHAPAFAQDAQHPAVSITLAEALKFCEWLTVEEKRSGVLRATQRYRLPTSAEWDAAVGLNDALSDGSRYPWGADWPPLRQSGNYNARRIEGGRDDGFAYTAPVGQFAPSPTGFYDLGGNVWEWTLPEAQSTGDIGKLRGGSWLYWRQDCLESRYQAEVQGQTRSPGVGFRCVLEDSAEVEAYREQRKHSQAQMRSTLTEKQEVTDADLQRAREARAKATGPTDPSERARLIDRPKVSQDEVERMRSEMKGKAGNAPEPQPALVK
ncbi:MAG: formylglycine-generating enzyme family protein [Verrucomicrobiaceae bacterium]